MSFSSWVDERIANALTDERIKVAVDAAMNSIKADLELQFESALTLLRQDIENIPKSVSDAVASDIAKLQELIASLVQQMFTVTGGVLPNILGDITDILKGK